MELNPSGLQTMFFKPLTRPEQPEHSCRLQLLHSPMTAEPYREKTRPLRPRRSCFGPTEPRVMQRAWVEAPGAAPGSEWFIAAAIYFHSRQAGTPNIERFQAKWRPVRVKKTRQNEKAAQSLGKTDRNPLPAGREHAELGWPRQAQRSKSCPCPRIRRRLPFRRRIPRH